MARKSTARSAYTWKAFFEMFSKITAGGVAADTESYVSTFTTQFKLKPAEYQLGDRVVIL